MASEYKMDFSRRERQAAEDFRRHQADLALTALQALATRFNQEIDALSCRSTKLLQGRKQ